MVDRKLVFPLAELIGRLTVDQIKEVKLPDLKPAVQEEMAALYHDIDQIVGERGIKLTARLMGVVVALAQLNVQIWELNDRMTAGDGDYAAQLKLAHQLNGVRNQLKNWLLTECGDRSPGARRTNYNTDGLEGWDLFALGTTDP